MKVTISRLFTVLATSVFLGLIPVGGAFAKEEPAPEGLDFRTNAELRSMSVFADVKDFTLPKTWTVVPGHGIDMYAPAVSGGKSVGISDEGKLTLKATLNVTIPKDGVYSMWLWFTKWVYDRDLELDVEQSPGPGTVGIVLTRSFFKMKEAGIPSWSYNVLRGSATAKLKAGPARLVICALPGGPVSINCVLLTQAKLKKEPFTGQPYGGINLGRLLTSAGERIDWHSFSPQCFVRFTILTPDAPAVKAGIGSSRHSEPWGATAPDIGDAKGGAVPPNVPSAWSDIAGVLDTGEAQATVWLKFKGSAPMPPAWRLKLEVAARPSTDAILRTFEEEWGGDTAGYVMPGNVPKYPERIESVATVTERHLALVNGLSLPGGDKDLRPKNLAIEAAAGSRSPRLLAKEIMVLARMGVNSVSLYDKASQESAAASGMDFSKAYYQYFINDNPQGSPDCSFDPKNKLRIEKELTDWAKSLEQNDPVQFRNIQYVVLADEPGTPNGLRHMTTCPFCQDAFRKWLMARGETPQRFGATGWEQIKPVLTDPKASIEMRRLAWFSSVFAQESAPLSWKYGTDILPKVFRRPIGSRVNFSDECVSGFGNTMSNGDGPNWFEFGRMNATTIPWTEDWMSWNPHLTPFLADVLRSTATTRDRPLGMYIIWGYGPPKDPHSAELRTMTAVARGVKLIDHYWYGPYYASTECAFSEDSQYVKSVAYVDRVLGVADDLLGPAVAPPRKVAILWSQATEQWKPDDAFTVERRMLHYALSMQQVPVEFICEKDVPLRLKEYQVLYLPANNLPQECGKAIAQWVKEGGTLVACGGGPERDEFNEPFEALRETLGVTGVEMKKDPLGYRGETLELAHVKATTEVSRGTEPHGIPVAGYRAVLTAAPTAKVLGTYKGGGAAMVENRVGKGRALTFGFNPGLSLLIALNTASCETFWNVFPENELHLIAAPVAEAGVAPPVATQVGVDAARLDAPQGSVVTLANFTLKPIATLKVLVRGITTVSRVVSSVRGPVEFKTTADGVVVELPLDTVDVIKFYR